VTDESPTGPPERFLAAYNDRDWDGLRAVLAPGCVYEEIGRPTRRVEGPDEVLRIFHGWAVAVPEATVEITGRVGGGGGVALEVELRGARTGPFGDFAPTRRRPAARAALVFYLDDGLIRELHNYYDSLVLYQVLGIGP
jgi:ketosteroid isomerase-like protein